MCVCVWVYFRKWPCYQRYQHLQLFDDLQESHHSFACAWLQLSQPDWVQTVGVEWLQIDQWEHFFLWRETVGCTTGAFGTTSASFGATLPSCWPVWPTLPSSWCSAALASRWPCWAKLASCWPWRAKLAFCWPCWATLAFCWPCWATLAFCWPLSLLELFSEAPTSQTPKVQPKKPEKIKEKKSWSSSKFRGYGHHRPKVVSAFSPRLESRRAGNKTLLSGVVPPASHSLGWTCHRVTWDCYMDHPPGQKIASWQQSLHEEVVRHFPQAWPYPA